MINKRDSVLLNLNLVTNNERVKNYIRGLIYRNGIIETFLESERSCNFALKNEKGEHVYVYINDGNVYAYSNFNGVREELNYNINSDGTVDIVSNSCGEYIELADSRQVDEFEEEHHYDKDGCLTFYKYKCDTVSRDDVTGLIESDSYLFNYTLGGVCYIVDNKIVQVYDFEYHCDLGNIKRKYFVSDYEEGMYGSQDDSIYKIPNYVEISGEEYCLKYKERIEEIKHNIDNINSKKKCIQRKNVI